MKTTGHNGFRPVPLTSVTITVFEHLILSYLQSFVLPLIDPHQFVYQANRSVEHLGSSNTYVCILFIDFNLAFNTIDPLKTWVLLWDSPVSLHTGLSERQSANYWSTIPLYHALCSSHCALSSPLFSKYTTVMTTMSLSTAKESRQGQVYLYSAFHTRQQSGNVLYRVSHLDAELSVKIKWHL